MTDRKTHTDDRNASTQAEADSKQRAGTTRLVNGELTAPAPSETGFPATIDRFRVQRILGRGGFGAVYLCWDPQMERDVAIKMPHAHLLAEADFRARFLREARAVASLHHASICPSYEVRELDTGDCLLVLGYIAGESLAERMSRGRLSQREAVEITLQAARGLQEAHRIGVIHRDLKPANILMDSNSRPVITDFGLARKIVASDATLTQKGEILGTPAYMPPEQAAGDLDNLTPATDVYSLGATLYEMLTGHRLFGGTVMQVLAQVMRDEPVPPSHSRPDIDQRLEAIVLKAISKSAGDRYPSMTVFAGTLQSLLDRGGPVDTENPQQSVGHNSVTVPMQIPAQFPATGSATGVEQPDARSSSRMAAAGAMSILRYAGVLAALLLMGVGGWFLFDKLNSQDPAQPGTNPPATLPPKVAGTHADGGTTGTHQPPVLLEADSPLLGQWVMYTESLPYEGAVVEFLPDGTLHFEVENETIGRRDQPWFEFQTRRRTSQQSSLSFGLQVHGEPARTALAGLRLRPSEYWEVAFDRESHAVGTRYAGASANIALEPVALYRPDVANGPPLLQTGRWLLGRWEFETRDELIVLDLRSDGQVFFQVGNRFFGGREALGNVRQSYHVEPIVESGEILMVVKSEPRVAGKQSGKNVEAASSVSTRIGNHLVLSAEESWLFRIGTDGPTANIEVDRTTERLVDVPEEYTVTIPVGKEFRTETRTRTVTHKVRELLRYNLLREGPSRALAIAPPDQTPDAPDVPEAAPNRPDVAVTTKTDSGNVESPARTPDSPPVLRPLSPRVKLKPPEELFGKEALQQYQQQPQTRSLPEQKSLEGNKAPAAPQGRK